jgi:hypothetical protein
MASTTSNAAPHFKHDCDDCAYLGHIACVDAVGKGDEADLYYCPGAGRGFRPTVIARFSSKGSDYESGLVEAPIVNEFLAVAAVRAIKHLQDKLDQINELSKR